MYLRVNIEAINGGMLVPVIRQTASGVFEHLEVN